MEGAATRGSRNVENPYFQLVYARDLSSLRASLKNRRSTQDNVDACSAFVAAICNGLTEVVDAFVEEGLDLNRRDKSGFTPLIWAVHSGHGEIAKRLLGQGAPVNTADTYSMTPLHHAARRQSLELVQLLVEAGADVTARNCDGKTPLVLARERYFRVPQIPLIGPGYGVTGRVWDTAVARYLRSRDRAG
jgi:ankyrin repeat protein